MGRCVGPCDGTVSLEEYGRIVADAAQTLAAPDVAIARLSGQMVAASAELDFERAAALKQRLTELEALRKRPFEHAAPLDRFRWLAMTPGPRKGFVKLFTVTPLGVREIGGLVDEPKGPTELLRHVLHVTDVPADVRPATPADVERLSLLTHHLTLPKAKRESAFLRVDELDDRALRTAFKSVAAREVPEVEEEGASREVA